MTIQELQTAITSAGGTYSTSDVNVANLAASYPKLFSYQYAGYNDPISGDEVWLISAIAGSQSAPQPTARPPLTFQQLAPPMAVDYQSPASTPKPPFGPQMDLSTLLALGAGFLFLLIVIKKH
jgi:hypothetical protein